MIEPFSCKWQTAEDVHGKLGCANKLENKCWCILHNIQVRFDTFNKSVICKSVFNPLTTAMTSKLCHGCIIVSKLSFLNQQH